MAGAGVMSRPGSQLFLRRCLAEGAGDVAFVKHSTVLENTDGEGRRAQTPGLTPDGLQRYGPTLFCISLGNSGQVP